MNIREYLGRSIVSVALLLACAVPGLAKDSRTVTLGREVVLSGTTLRAGKYLVQWDAHSSQATVEFARDHKVVLSTSCKLEDRGERYGDNEIVYDTANGASTISEIRFAGSSEVLVFNQ